MNQEENELVELQTKIAFQEQHLEEFNQVLVSQQKQIDALQRELLLLKEQYEELRDSQGGPQGIANADEKPPHY